MTLATKTILLVTALAVSLVGAGIVVLAGEPCVQPDWPWNAYGFAIDPNAMTGYALAPIVCEAGVPTVVARRACDLDGDPLGPIEVLFPPAGVAARIVGAGTYEVRIAAPRRGISYITLRGWDTPDPNVADPNSTVVTIPVQAVARRNRPPVLY